MQPEEYSLTSGEKTASAQVLDGPGFFYGIALVTDGTNAATFTFYDGLTATGTEFLPEMVFPSSATQRRDVILLPYAIGLSVGCYIKVSVAGQGTVKYTVLTRLQR